MSKMKHSILDKESDDFVRDEDGLIMTFDSDYSAYVYLSKECDLKAEWVKENFIILKRCKMLEYDEVPFNREKESGTISANVIQPAGGQPEAEGEYTEMIYQRNKQCPYSEDSQNETAYYKGFEDSWTHFTAIRWQQGQQPSPTIGARWVTKEEISTLRWLLNKASEKPKSQIGTLLTNYTDKEGIENVKHLENLWAKLENQSPATFPTREQAEEWAVNEFVVKLSNKTPVLAALAMYDWIFNPQKDK